MDGAKTKKRRMGRTPLTILIVILCIPLLIVSLRLLRMAKHRFSPADGYGDYVFDGGRAQFDLDLFPSLVIDEDATELKIMQLADPQIKLGIMPERDRKTLRAIRKAVEEQKPDICVVTGDLTLSVSTYDAYVHFADFMHELGVKWTLAYGNHDGQYDCSKYTLYKLLKRYDNCLFSRGPSDIHGESNFLVNVYRGEKRADKLVYSLVMLDSGMYPDTASSTSNDKVYDWIKQDQMDWYSWAMNGLKSIKPDISSTMFFHIPIKEYATMYYINERNSGRDVPQAVLESLPDVEVRDVNGSVCESDKNERECVYGDDGYTVGILYQGNAAGASDHPDVFRYIKELGCTKAVFCGHDHVNTLKGYYDGVYLGYGLCCGYHTYPFFDGKNFLTELFGVADKIEYNMELWVDENGERLYKGVTVIDVSLSPGSYGALAVTDMPHEKPDKK